MKFTIEPMTMGQIFSRAKTLLIARWGLFLAIEAIIVAPTLILELALPDVATGQAAIVLIFPMIILGPIGSAATLHVITQEYLGETVSLRQAFRFAFDRFLPILGTSILSGIGIVLALVACFIPGIYLAIVWAFVSQIVVMENLSGFSALSRSKNLVEGYFWNVFATLSMVCVGIWLFSGVINLGLQVVLPIQGDFPGNPFAREEGIDSYVNYAINHVVATTVNGIGQTFAAICTTLLYFDLRNRKEAFDMTGIVAWMAQYRDWRDEPVDSEPLPPRVSSDTSIKPVGDAPVTSIQDPNAPRPDNIQQ